MKLFVDIDSAGIGQAEFEPGQELLEYLCQQLDKLAEGPIFNNFGWLNEATLAARAGILPSLYIEVGPDIRTDGEAFQVKTVDLTWKLGDRYIFAWCELRGHQAREFVERHIPAQAFARAWAGAFTED